jgi:hypothetical protein
MVILKEFLRKLRATAVPLTLMMFAPAIYSGFYYLPTISLFLLLFYQGDLITFLSLRKQMSAVKSFILSDKVVLI